MAVALNNPALSPLIGPDEPFSKLLAEYDFHGKQRISSGGFGSVYVILRPLTGQRYALKEIKATDHNRLLNVRREKFALKLFDSPFIVKLYHSYQESRVYYFVMDLAENGDLHTNVKNHGPLSIASTTFYAAETILGLEYLRSKNFVHRDIKPENILVDKNFHVQLSDFGSAKMIGQPQGTSIIANAADLNSMTGTYATLAPEVLLNEPVSFGTDLWNLGFVIFGMYTRRLLAELKDMNNSYDYLRSVDLCHYMYPFNRPDPRVHDLVYHLTRRNPDDRIGTVNFQDLKDHTMFRHTNWDMIQHMYSPGMEQTSLNFRGKCRGLDVALLPTRSARPLLHQVARSTPPPGARSSPSPGVRSTPPPGAQPAPLVAAPTHSPGIRATPPPGQRRKTPPPVAPKPNLGARSTPPLGVRSPPPVAPKPKLGARSTPPLGVGSPPPVAATPQLGARSTPPLVSGVTPRPKMGTLPQRTSPPVTPKPQLDARSTPQLVAGSTPRPKMGTVPRRTPPPVDGQTPIATKNHLPRSLSYQMAVEQGSLPSGYEVLGPAGHTPPCITLMPPAQHGLLMSPDHLPSRGRTRSYPYVPPEYDVATAPEQLPGRGRTSTYRYVPPEYDVATAPEQLPSRGRTGTIVAPGYDVAMAPETLPRRGRTGTYVAHEYDVPISPETLPRRGRTGTYVAPGYDVAMAPETLPRRGRTGTYMAPYEDAGMAPDQLPRRGRTGTYVHPGEDVGTPIRTVHGTGTPLTPGYVANTPQRPGHDEATPYAVGPLHGEGTPMTPDDGRVTPYATDTHHSSATPKFQSVMVPMEPGSPGHSAKRGTTLTGYSYDPYGYDTPQTPGRGEVALQGYTYDYSSDSADASMRPGGTQHSSSSSSLTSLQVHHSDQSSPSAVAPRSPRQPSRGGTTLQGYTYDPSLSYNEPLKTKGSLQSVGSWRSQTQSLNDLWEQLSSPPPERKTISDPR